MSWKNTEGKKNDCRIRVSCMCGSISHSCRRGGHPVPFQGPQLQGKPVFADTTQYPRCSQAAAETTVSPGHGLGSFPAALGSPAVAHGCSSSLFLFTCALCIACWLPTAPPCIPALPARAEVPRAPRQSPQPLPVPASPTGHRGRC